MSDKPICAKCNHLNRHFAGDIPSLHSSSWECSPTKDINYITGDYARKYCEGLNSSGECTLFKPLPQSV